MAREVFKIVDLVVTFQEEPGLDVYLIFELQDAKVKTSVRSIRYWPSHRSRSAGAPWQAGPPHAACMHACSPCRVSADTIESRACRCSGTRVPRPACASPTT